MVNLLFQLLLYHVGSQRSLGVELPFLGRHFLTYIMTATVDKYTDYIEVTTYPDSCIPGEVKPYHELYLLLTCQLLTGVCNRWIEYVWWTIYGMDDQSYHFCTVASLALPGISYLVS